MASEAVISLMPCCVFLADSSASHLPIFVKINIFLFISLHRKRLEDSRKLWQFYWDTADEKNWIKEKEQIASAEDVGHDLTTVYLLVGKHNALLGEVKAHEPQLMAVAGVGDELIRDGHFGSDRIQVLILMQQISLLR